MSPALADDAGASDRAAGPQAGKVLRAGAAVADITPPLGEEVVGGFAPFPATEIHDRLHARCLILDNGETTIGFVICDNLGIPHDVFDAAREQIAAQSKLPVENLLMAATHTHSSCRASTGKYRPILISGIVDAVIEAFANLQPAKIAWGGIDEPSEVFNRRWYVKDPKHRTNPFGGIDTVRMNPPRGNPSLLEPAGPVDPEISFISVQSISGRPIALLANYSLHYVGGVNKGDVSADYFGIFANQIGSMIGATPNDKFVGMLCNGTSGDVNNINFRISSREQSQVYAKYEKMTEVANKVASRVAQAHQELKFQDWVPLGSRRSELKMKMRKPDQQLREYFENVMAQDEDAPRHHRYERTYAARVQRLQEGPDEIMIPLQAMRIGDLGVAAIPFEVFTEIGLEIKVRAPLDDVFTIELANDSRGYLPTPRQHKLGGYETWMGTSRVQLDASELIVDEIISLMESLHD
ncbi:MAG: hypothetical protein HKN47_11130 [Pirellulaceae bacterium]|nr:hypothetical protein [Pirellulaceae bacterium]